MAELYIALEDRREYNLAEEVYGDPNDLFLGGNLWHQRRYSNVALLKAAEAKDVDRYVRLAGGLDQALLRITMEKDTVKFPEGKIVLFASELLRRGARVNCIDLRGNTPLHLSAQRGFVHLARELLKWGAQPNILDSKGHTPMEIAIHLALGGAEEVVEIYNLYAVFIIKEMEPSRVRECFIAEPDKPARLSFHTLLNHPDMKETVQAILDCLIERVAGRKTTYTVHYSMLEADKDGRILTSKSRKNHKRITALEKIAWKNNKEVVTHLSVLLLIQSKWRRFARTLLIFQFFFWLMLMSCLTSALVLAASQDDPRIYYRPVDIFRGICEGLSLLLLVLTTLNEIHRVFLQFPFFVHNYFEVLTMVLVIVLIPLRIVDSNAQWVLACLIHISFAIGVFKYLRAMPLLSKYICIVHHIVVKDLIPFLLMSIVTIFTMSGALYFALREEMLVDVVTLLNTTSSESTGNVGTGVNESLVINTGLNVNFEETSTYPRVFLTGIRLIVEGQNFLTYFGLNGYRAFGVLIYILFLFVLHVILLNLLIAQMTDTYSSAQEDAQRELIINQARNVVTIERTGFSLLRCVTDFFISEETWKNPKSQVHKINQKAVDSIEVSTKLIRSVINQHSLLLEELRDSVAEQKISLNMKLERLSEQIKLTGGTQG